MTSNRRLSLLPQYGSLDPRQTVLGDYNAGQEVKATVVGSIDYGMLVELTQ